MNIKHRDLHTNYKVFKELFVVCWAGNKKKIRENFFYSRVDIELVNERVKLFYSALDEVTIDFNDHSFSITEYIPLGLNDKTSYYPLEKQTLLFYENGYYKIESEFLFEPPQYNRKMLHHIYNATSALIVKLQKNTPLSDREILEVENIPSTLMICYLNGFEEAKTKLIEVKQNLKSFSNQQAYINFKEAMRVLRKVKYKE
jgi:hypothetical protein